MVTAEQLIREQETAQDLINASSRTSIDSRRMTGRERLQKVVGVGRRIAQGTGQFIEAKEKRLNVNVQRTFVPAPMLTRQQQILNEMLGGGQRNWGTGNNLPVINHDLDNPQGGGIIKSRDGGRTGGFFGMRR